MLEEYIGLFVLGIVTFLSPCSIALISVYLTYAIGISKSTLKGFLIGCSFTVAMCLVFFFLGYALTALIPIKLLNYGLFLGIAGVLLSLFGLNNLGLFSKIGLTTHLGSSLNERMNSLKLNALTRVSKYNYAISSFFFGLVISVALGPCSLSIVLPAILLTMFTAPTPFHGGFLLFIFGLGHALPVIALSTLLATTRKLVSQKISEKSHWLTKGFGVAFLVIGIIMVGYAIGGALL
ncbi:MAG: sulfite exporter TauE/SafE family protein [Candidatus Bathyarchaeota archaeon]|nr:sulfite exporter TauE/SafE family protein [Candidatus Bathyarchaeota archaeon]